MKNYCFLSILCLICFLYPSRLFAQYQENSNFNIESVNRDELSVVLMQNYFFCDCDSTSDTLVIPFRDILGENKTYSDEVSTMITYVGINIWWPGRKKREINEKEILEKAVLPAIIEPFDRSKSNSNRYLLSETAYQMYINMKGIKNPWFSKPVQYDKQVEEIMRKYPENPMPYLVKSQAVAFQNLLINDKILKNLEELYPEEVRPWGVYLEYWQDPSSWTFSY